MFDNEIAINRLQLDLFDRIVADVPEDSLFQPQPGHHHPPVWILGHLAITGEMGQGLLGGAMTHPEWVATFGPGSKDAIEDRDGLSKAMLESAVRDAYKSLRELATVADPKSLAKPHGFALFDGSPITTVGQLAALLMTNHFGFHLAQLSSCRRAAGHAALF